MDQYSGGVPNVKRSRIPLVLNCVVAPRLARECIAGEHLFDECKPIINGANRYMQHRIFAPLFHVITLKIEAMAIKIENTQIVGVEGYRPTEGHVKIARRVEVFCSNERFDISNDQIGICH